MSHLHASPNLLLSHQEVTRLDEFSQAQGLELSRALLTGRPGLLAPTGTEWLVSVESAPEQTLQLSPGLALDGRGRLLRQPATGGLRLPRPDVWYVLRVAYATHSLEPGTVSIGPNGQLTGDAACRFTQVLRGLPGTPTLIRLVRADGTPSLNGGLDHEVQAVGGEASATLSTAGLVAEGNLRYQVVGAFQFGWQPEAADELVYRYDGTALFLLPEAFDPATDALPAGYVPAEAFTLARVRRTAAGLDVEDKRAPYWQAAAETSLSRLGAAERANPVVALEQLVWPLAGTPRAASRAQLGWGLLAEAWSLDPAQRQLTLTQASGGRYQSLALVDPADYVGWYVSRAGELNVPGLGPEPEPGPEPRWRITAASKPTAGSLRLTLAGIDPAGLRDPGRPLLVLPDAALVHFDVTPLGGPGRAYGPRYHSAAVANGRTELELPCGGQAVDYFVQYCFSTGAQRSAWRPLNKSAYYAEDQFDGTGALRAGARRSGDAAQGAPRGYLSVQPAPDGYRGLLERVDTGDLPGVELRTVRPADPALALQVGVHRRYQKIAVDGALTQPQYLDLRPTRSVAGDPTVALAEGNNFSLELTGVLLAGPYALRLVSGYLNPASIGTVLAEFDGRDIAAMSRGGLFVSCTYGAGRWHVFKHRRHELPLGTVLQLNRLGAYNPLEKFDPATGLGAAEWQDYALMDGRNGTDNMGSLVAVGYDGTSNPAVADSWGLLDGLSTNVVDNYGALGNLGGARQSILTRAQLPAHDHLLPPNNDATDTGNGRALRRVDEGANSDRSRRTLSTGENQPIDNRQRYRVLAYVQRIA